MRENGKALTAWLHSSRFLLPSAVSSGQGRHRKVSASFPEAINMIEKFWRKVWDQPTNCEELNKAREGRLTAPSGEPFDSHACVSAEELQMQARHDAHGTAGPDGWTAAEVSHLPLAYWSEFSTMLARWMQTNSFPQVFRHCRMIMIPKDGFELASGPIPVDKLRPISVFPVHYRICSSAFARRSSTKAWLQGRIPDCTHGAVQGRSAASAIAALEASFHGSDKSILISLDQQQCFDRVSPELALAHLTHAGFPNMWANLLAWVWKDQQRWIQTGRYSAQSPASVNSSLPQGCACAPLALVNLLVEATRDVQTLHTVCDPVTQTTFLDDRNAVTQSPQQAKRYLERWEHWCIKLGLLENRNKAEDSVSSSKRRVAAFGAAGP